MNQPKRKSVAGPGALGGHHVYSGEDRSSRKVQENVEQRSVNNFKGPVESGGFKKIKSVRDNTTIEGKATIIGYALTSATQVMKMPKFCANLSFLFTEKPFLERYKLAKHSGFACVETGFPFGLTKDQVVEAKNSSNVDQVLLNIYTGDVSKGELGFAAIPGKEQQFKESLAKTVEFAQALGAKKVHVMSGKIPETVTPAHDQVYEENLKYAVDLLEKHNILALIEPINKYSVPNYYMNSYQRAIEVIQKINSPNLKLMLDVFHLQQIQGNVARSVKDLMKYVGHVQIAQVPDRHEPNSDGELNYKYILNLLENEGYNDWIGLEYIPAEDGFKWIKEMGYSL